MTSFDATFDLNAASLLTVIRGFRNGVIYGAKVRFPHALVMTLLFKSGSFESKIRSIIKATYHHAKNLGTFVAIFKGVCVLLRHLRQKETGTNVLLGGLIGGMIVWGDNNAINSQINMYILSRITVGLARLAVKRGYFEAPKHSFRIYAGVCWAIVMYLFYYEHTPRVPILQKSLASSMSYLYLDSNEWPNTSNVIKWLME